MKAIAFPQRGWQSPFCFQNPAAKRNGNFEHFVIFCE